MKNFEFNTAEIHIIKQALKRRYDECTDRLNDLKSIPKSDYKDYEVNYYHKALSEVTNLLDKVGYSEFN